MALVDFVDSDEKKPEVGRIDVNKIPLKDYLDNLRVLMIMVIIIHRQDDWPIDSLACNKSVGVFALANQKEMKQQVSAKIFSS